MNQKRKLRLINELREQYKDAPKQGTDEWRRQRTGIGGSEMSTITGDNSYQSIKDLIKSHVGLSEFTGNKYTQWGCLFEEQIRLIVEILIDCTIHEIGSVQGCINHHKYSPDGLATMKLLIGTEWKYKSHINMYNILTQFTKQNGSYYNKNGKKIAVLYDYKNVLLEFKCPYIRIPNDKIPKIYIPQIKSGLCDLPCCDIGLFVDAVFRKCAYKDWKPNNIYDNEYHNSDKTPAKEKIIAEKFINPLVLGGIGLYIPLANMIKKVVIPTMGTQEYNSFRKKQNIWKTIVNCGPYEEETLLDFGNGEECPTYLFNGLLDLYSTGDISAYYFPTKIYYEEVKNVAFLNAQCIIPPNNNRFKRKDTINIFRQWCYDHDCKPVGFLPWKLFKCDFLIQYRDENFLKRCESKVNEVMKCIHDILQIDSMIGRMEALNQLNITSMKHDDHPKSKNIRGIKKKKVGMATVPRNIIDSMMDGAI